MRRGTIPADGRLLATLTLDDALWELYERFPVDRPLSDEWRNLKLISRTPARKANYWLGWHVDDERLADVHDARILRERYPAVYQWVALVLADPEAAALVYGQ